METTKEFFSKRNEAILKDYKALEMTVEKIAKKYDMTPRTIQRIVRSLGFIRTVSEANKASAKFKNYEALRIPDELKSKRKSIPSKLRYELLLKYKECVVCKNDYKLQIDHIDGNPSNNDATNLQVLCTLCNQGKK